jgi:hypothetical protein
MYVASLPDRDRRAAEAYYWLGVIESGSSGSHVPADVKARLAELEALAAKEPGASRR